jgi:hypothetical protein
MHAAHAELASLAGTDGERVPVTSWAAALRGLGAVQHIWPVVRTAGYP